MLLNSCRERIKNGPILNKIPYSLRTRDCCARFPAILRSRSRFLSSTTYHIIYVLSCSLPRSAAIIFGPDVMDADAEIALSPRSTEDRSLCLLHYLLRWRHCGQTTLSPRSTEDRSLCLLHYLLRWRHCGQTTLSPRSTEDRSLCLLHYLLR